MLPEGFERQSLYTTKKVLYCFNRLIYEYDIHSANTSICRYYGLLPEKKIKSLEEMTKDKRVRAIGMLQKDNPSFKKALEEGFVNIRKEFYEANELDIDDIISIKKDAIFTTKMCDKTKFKDLEFACKHVYTSFAQFKRKEFYYREDHVDVKGLNDKLLPLHEEGMLLVLKKFFSKMETGTPREALAYLYRLVSSYKRGELSLCYYREFNEKSCFRVKGSEDTYDDYWDDRIEELDISYNLQNVIIPLTKIAL